MIGRLEKKAVLFIGKSRNCNISFKPEEQRYSLKSFHIYAFINNHMITRNALLPEAETEKSCKSYAGYLGNKLAKYGAESVFVSNGKIPDIDSPQYIGSIPCEKMQQSWINLFKKTIKNKLREKRGGQI